MMTRDQILEQIATIMVMDKVHDDETARDILDFIEPFIRADERKQIALALWPHVQPITSWIAHTNTTDEWSFRQ